MIFQQIWEADMRGNGVKPLIKGMSDHQKDPNEGYVVVNMDPYPEGCSLNKDRDPDDIRQVNVLEQVHIPNRKMESYNKFKDLHDNYEWQRNAGEDHSGDEKGEVSRLLDFVISTEPIEEVRRFAVEERFIDSTIMDKEWKELLHRIWFELDEESTTSGFEHVFIGEENSRGGLGGHHFWYHYHINDGPYEVTRMEDVIEFLDHVEVGRAENSRLAEVITIKYKYHKLQPNGSKHPLVKGPKGGFFVGLSVEGLMAVGTAAYFLKRTLREREETIDFIINGERFDIQVYTANRGRGIRTFFPMISSPVEVPSCR